MDALILQQEDLLEHLSKAYQNYRKSPKDRITQSYIESRLENIEKMSNTFFEVHSKLTAGVSKSKRGDYEYFVKDYYEQFEELFTDYKSKMKEDLRKFLLMKPIIKESAPSTCDVKLPQIQLPTFAGGYEEWQTFFDMFVSLIHNNSSLSAVQKLHYLKSSLSGEPDNLLKNLPTTASNYDEAWKQLTRRYNNKRYNSNEVMKRLFAQKNITTESATPIKHLLDTTSACLKSLDNLGIKTDSWDPIVNHLITSKLDQESRKQWEIHVSQMESDALPTWEQLRRFLETRFRTLEMVDCNKNITRPVQNVKQIIKQRSFHSAVENEKVKSNACAMCSGQHWLYQCKQFGRQSPEARTEFVQSKGLCFNCLAPNHSVKVCHQSTSCRRCGKRHHTLLHYEREQNQGSATTEPQSTENTSNVVKDQPSRRESESRFVAHFAQEDHANKVLLATAMVKVNSESGYSQVVRALVDQGSEASFITESTVQSLGLKRVPINGLISGVGDGQTRTKHMVSLCLESLHNPKFVIQFNAYVLSTLTSFLPSSETSISNWPAIANLPLADPKYNVPSRVDIILGVNEHSEIILDGLIKHPSKNGPVAQRTELGWILSGGVQNGESSVNRKLINLHIQVKEDQLLKQFWEIEREPDCIKKRLTKEEIRCEEIYEKTTTRDQEGRYIVRLPFKSSDPECFYGQSKEITARRFKLLEKRLLKDPSYYTEYTKVIDDYIEQNHMHQITDVEEINKPAVYLPQHAVIRNDKQTSKIRVVFDGSCKGVNNVSLNDNLLVGPKLQQDLRHILMRWRRHPICIVADLVQMYRQVRVHDQDTDCQRIVWRYDPNEPMKHYRMLRLTFGTTCAPYLAVKSLQQLAKDEQSQYPIAAKITLEDYYMDDLLTGCDTEKEAREIYEQMNKLMKAGGFNLQKWSSNSDTLLEHIREENQSADQTRIFKSDDMIKVLGISWNKSTDNFEYTLKMPEMSEPVTKRRVLSDIARLYDPMGWIAPVIITAKIFIQRLWKSGLSWDEPLTPDLFKEWCNFRTDLTNVQSIVIPRWLNTHKDDQVELHAFSDASQAAYAAAIYLKSRDECGNTVVHLITTKTKVSPIEKEVSIPRLELCGALLAAKLIFEVSQIMQVPKENLYAWSDSTIVLAWLRGEPSRWTTFVSNRVSEILTILDFDQWGHVVTNQNPADCASRGMGVTELVNHSLWWHGPKWLCEENEYKVGQKVQEFSTKQEERPIKTLTTTIQEREKEDYIWTKFSSLTKTLRVLSLCKKFINLIKLPKSQRSTLPTNVTVKEMDEILQIYVRGIQNVHFRDEIKQLKSQGSVHKRSQLHTLCPLLDENGILRVGGRIHKADVNFEKRHPAILPSESHLTKLIIADAHSRTLHGGPQIMLNYLRSKYWIIRARELVKKCYRECVTCLRHSRQNNNTLMGQLPEARLKPAKPFEAAGVDFTGHINIRFSPGRGAKSYKGYICLFVCMTSKAVHLEAVSDMTAEGFIAAFRRFVSRRGRCKNIYSDNGTNFVGADKELRGMLNRAVSKLPNEIAQLLVSEGTTWHFIPPHAPNFGGLWEAGIRSTKTHLKRVIGDSTLTFEELSTVLTQIEACLNSRPLSHLSDNPDDPLPLTPGHFLVGEPLVVIPDEDYERLHVTGLQRWKLTQKMVNDFWRKWSEEYLVTLNQRYKWSTKKSEPLIDDIVIIKDHNLPPAKWLLGRVVEKHTGKDDVTRVVTIRTKNVLPMGIDVGLLGVGAYYLTRLKRPDPRNVTNIFGPLPGSKESGTHPEKLVRCIAHRGAGLDAPENTLEAFKYCVEQDVKFIELDVRTSKDGKLVLLHDQGLERLAGASISNVHIMDWESIKDIDVGAKHPNRQKFKEVHLCLLDDALEYLLENDVKMIIDIKGEDKQVIEGILRTFLARPKLYEYAAITCFNPFVLYQIRKKDPHIVGAMSYRPYAFSAQDYDAENGPSNPRYGDNLPVHGVLRAADFLHSHLWRWTARWCGVSAVLLHKDIVSPSEIQYWRDLGVRCAGWCVNRPLEKLYWRGVLKAPYLANTLLGEPEGMTLSDALQMEEKKAQEIEPNAEVLVDNMLNSERRAVGQN